MNDGYTYGWYFSGKDRKLRHGDNRSIRTGSTHKVTGQIKLCVFGLHASKRVIDALEYAPGPILHRVRTKGNIIFGHDKFVSNEREYLYSFDATELLERFARQAALLCVKKIQPYCSEEGYKLITKWLLTGNLSLRSAAKSAAWSAAKSATWSAAWSAEKSAAESAAESAARSAAWSAAKSATESATESAAWSAAWSAAKSSVESAAWSAAESAAWSAVESAEKNKQEEILLALISDYKR